MRPILRQKLLIPFAALLLGGCATTATQQLPAPAAGSPNVQQVRADSDANLFKTVRWGGTIVDVKNKNGETRVEIIAQPLRRSGQPDFRQASDGRFIAVFDQFLEPTDYKVNSQITVFGLVNGKETGKIGEAEYEYPVVEISDHQLWQGRNARYAGRSHNKYGGYQGHRGYGHNSYYGGFTPRLSISLGGRHGRFGSRIGFGGHFGGGFRGGFRGHGRRH